MPKERLLIDPHAGRRGLWTRLVVNVVGWHRRWSCGSKASTVPLAGEGGACYTPARYSGSHCNGLDMRIAGIWLLAALICLAVGCVQRRLTVRSNPPGARVYIDNREIGRTPVSTDYVYYGTRQFRLEADGFETLTTYQYLPPPWYQIPPLDFVSENLFPGEIRDERTVFFQLQPQAVVPMDRLLSRADELRRRSQTAASATAVLPGESLPAPSGEAIPAPAAPYVRPAVPHPPPTRGG